MMDAVKSKDIMKRMAEFDRLRTNDPIFKVFPAGYVHFRYDEIYPGTLQGYLEPLPTSP